MSKKTALAAEYRNIPNPRPACATEDGVVAFPENFVQVPLDAVDGPVPYGEDGLAVVFADTPNPKLLGPVELGVL
jgi:hypothetical protein